MPQAILSATIYFHHLCASIIQHTSTFYSDVLSGRINATTHELAIVMGRTEQLFSIHFHALKLLQAISSVAYWIISDRGTKTHLKLLAPPPPYYRCHFDQAKPELANSTLKEPGADLWSLIAATRTTHTGSQGETADSICPITICLLVALLLGIRAFVAMFMHASAGHARRIRVPLVTDSREQEPDARFEEGHWYLVCGEIDDEEDLKRFMEYWDFGKSTRVHWEDLRIGHIERLNEYSCQCKSGCQLSPMLVEFIIPIAPSEYYPL